MTASDRYDFDSRSVVSWACEDDFDRQSSIAVQDAFRAIDDVLYGDAEGENTMSEVLRHECEEWKETFTHLRLKGQQLLPSFDDGVQVTSLLFQLASYQNPLFTLIIFSSSLRT
jgi:hypothetical protein